MFDSTRRTILQAAGIGGATAAIAGCAAPSNDAETNTNTGPAANNGATTPATADVDRIAADPTNIPAPVDWDSARTHEIELITQEVTAEIEPGVTFDYMTFGGQVPGPMIRVRRGDTVRLTLTNPEDNGLPHNVDFHAVYGTGGGANATTVAPGESATIEFKATYPGSFIYHCAVPNLDKHISAGMFGMIVVEPENGLPTVDNEFYLGQHEIYTDGSVGEEGHHGFDMAAMAREEPTYVVFNGEKYALTPDRYGAMTASKGETSRVFMVCGGPNLPSYFHPIGNVWTQAWPNGTFNSDPDRYSQTMTVPPGSCFVGTMDHPVPETIKLVDHALSRVARKGLMAAIAVDGSPEPEIYDPDPEE